MDLQPEFQQFLSNIRLTDSQLQDLKQGHTALRNRLTADPALSAITVSTFLQGSYRRATAVRPKGGTRADVDVVVVTTLREAEYAPQAAMDLFVPLLNQHYKGKWQFQGRSIGIELSYVDLDVVVTSAPSEQAARAVLSKSLREAETIEEPDWSPSLAWVPLHERATLGASAAASQPQWKTEPLRIPNRDAECWDDTHPLEQIRVTFEKNAATGGRFVNVVKALKWWRRLNAEPKHPKGYPLEHLIWHHCPNTIASIAEGVVLTLESIRDRYAAYAQAGLVPPVPDHGVPHHNVLGRVSAADFAGFHRLVVDAAARARAAYDAEQKATSHRLWYELFGSRFPEPPTRGEGMSGGDDDGNGGGGYTPRVEPTVVPTRSERWG